MLLNKIVIIISEVVPLTLDYEYEIYMKNIGVAEQKPNLNYDTFPVCHHDGKVRSYIIRADSEPVE